MESEKIDLILHPVRLRILQAIGSETVSTQVIADRLPDIPKSSIYRHLKLLLDGGFVVIEETKQVLGTLEKYYRLSQQPHLGPEEVAGLSAADHIHYFNIFLMTLQQDFANYIESAEESSGSLDIMADLVGYTEVSFYASEEELKSISIALNTVIQGLLPNRSGGRRRKRKFATITHPVADG